MRSQHKTRRRSLFVVYTGHRDKDSAPFDYFTVQKLRDGWRIVSPVSHEIVKREPVIVTQLNTSKDLTKRCRFNRLKALSKPKGSERRPLCAHILRWFPHFDMVPLPSGFPSMSWLDSPFHSPRATRGFATPASLPRSGCGQVRRRSSC